MGNNYFAFAPVGQGLFYGGFIDGGSYSFVYDCGSENGIKALKPYIDSLPFLSGKNSIDFLAISHFHRDHINGINYLLNTIKVEKVYLPYLGEKDITRKFLAGISYFELFKEQEVKRIDEEFNIFSFIEALYHSDGNIVIKKRKTLIKKNWKFVFLNNPISKYQETFLIKEIKKLMSIAKVTTIEELFQKHYFPYIKAIYKKVFYNQNLMNNSSMVLLHYPLGSDDRSCLCRSLSKFFYVNHFSISKAKKPYSLLTGDLTFNSKIASAIKKEIKNDSLVIALIPHHGAKNEWLYFYTYFPSCDYYIVSFGLHNSYGHPFLGIPVSIPSKYFQVCEYSWFDYLIK